VGPSLTLVDLTKRYGGLIAVDALSLEVRPGEVLGLLGPNGAGKTTTIGMICGLVAADSGRILVDGLALVGLPGAGEERASEAARRSVGYCPQDIVVWDRLGCLEQLVFVARLYGASRADAARSGKALLGALGLEDKARVQARRLSGGMRRRLNLALALVHGPRLVVLDEAEAGLDPQSRALVREYIRGLAGEKTVLVTTHDMDEAERIADRVAIVDRGRLLELDSPSALLARYGEDGRPAPDLEYVFLKLTGRRLRE
jgi:ABC-2 type transport system ATP-binding protein